MIYETVLNGLDILNWFVNAILYWRGRREMVWKGRARGVGEGWKVGRGRERERVRWGGLGGSSGDGGIWGAVEGGWTVEGKGGRRGRGSVGKRGSGKEVGEGAKEKREGGQCRWCSPEFMIQNKFNGLEWECLYMQKRYSINTQKASDTTTFFEPIPRLPQSFISIFKNSLKNLNWRREIELTLFEVITNL